MGAALFSVLPMANDEPNEPSTSALIEAPMGLPCTAMSTIATAKPKPMPSTATPNLRTTSRELVTR